MKGFLLNAAILMTIGSAFAIENIQPYSFDSSTMKFTVNSQIVSLDKSKYHYAEKYMQKAQDSAKVDKKIKYYEKILKKYPDYMPALYELMFIYAANSESQQVYNYALRLRELNTDGLMPKDMLSDIIARSCVHMKKYSEAVKEFESITDFEIAKRNYLILAETYLKLNNYNNVIKYASKISKFDYNFYDATELLYIANYNLKDNEKAYEYAQQLIKLKPDIAKNYMRAAQNCPDKSLKLNYLYKTKNILLKNPDAILYTVDNMIAELEQPQIDNAYKKITDFVVKPDWKKVYMNNSPDINFYIENWSKRQDDFFKTAKDCIAKYEGNNLVKCFEALNYAQDKKTEQVKDLLKEINDAKKQKEHELMIQRLLMLQQQMNYSRYYYYPYRYFYRPYLYW